MKEKQDREEIALLEAKVNELLKNAK